MEQNPYQSPLASVTAAVAPMRRGCQNCGVDAPTRCVEFHQNIGALFVRFHKCVRGNLCKSCIHRRFWSFTLTNLTFGWWGMISLVLTPVFIVNNVVRYLCCLRMPTVPPDAPSLRLSNDSIARLRPHTQALVNRLQAGESAEAVIASLTQQTGVARSQVELYLRALIAQSKREGVAQSQVESYLQSLTAQSQGEEN